MYTHLVRLFSGVRLLSLIHSLIRSVSQSVSRSVYFVFPDEIAIKCATALKIKVN